MKEQDEEQDECSHAAISFAQTFETEVVKNNFVNKKGPKGPTDG